MFYSNTIHPGPVLKTVAAAAMVVLSTGGGVVHAAFGAPGAVYTMTNDPGGNEILAFHRSANGILTADGVYMTGGLGSGGGLGNQGGVALSASHHRLFAVNAGSNEISAFSVGPNGLTLTDVEPSLGELPISLAVNGNLLYVLNGGGAGNIQGFTVGPNGALDPIADSMRALSGAAMTGPAEIAFTHDGGVLVVTEKATNSIDTYTVNDDGTTDGPFVFASNGMTPFGFDITSEGHLLVSEAFGGGPMMSAVSSYSVAPDGTLTLVAGSVPSFQTAACWLVVTRNSREAYVTNTGSGTISGYGINNSNGQIMLLDGVAGDAGPGTGPLDAATSTNGRFLYVLNSGSHEIGVWQVRARDGSLMLIQVVAGLPEAANGMAAH